MAITDLFGIANKVMSRFNFDRKAIRRNKIAKLEKQEKELYAKTWTPKLGRKLIAVQSKLRKLQQAAINE